MNIPTKTSLNDLPTIINECGDYRTRNGRRVTIHEIKPAGPPGTTSFSAKGSVWKTTGRMGLNPHYDAWHTSGRLLPLRLSPWDIVEHW